MGGAAGNYEYIPMTEEEEALHRKMLRRQKLLGMSIPPNHFMTSYEWEALNGWHGKKELLRYRRNRCVISWILFLTMLSLALAATCFVFSLLWSQVGVENPMPLQDQEQRTDMQREHMQQEQHESNQSSFEKFVPVPPYMMPGMGPRMKF